MTYRTKLPYLFIPAIFALALPSFAQDADECASDADCAEGSTCQKGMYVSPCDSESGGCDATPQEAEFGTCEKEPVACESDADCGEYLSCQSTSGGDCWASSDGSSGCSEPDPDAPHYCAPAMVECEVDGDCPRSFECAEQSSCPTVDCAEGEACDAPVCEATGGLCVPKEVECEVDADCPSEWSCVITSEYACSGGGAIEPEPDSDPDGGVEDPAAPPDVIEEEVCTEIETAGTCQPNAWEDAYFGGDADADADGEASGLGPEPGSDDVEEGVSGKGSNTDSSSDDGASSDAGGCSITPKRGATPAPLGLLLLLGAPLLMLRRRIAGISK